MYVEIFYHLGIIPKIAILLKTLRLLEDGFENYVAGCSRVAVLLTKIVSLRDTARGEKQHIRNCVRRRRSPSCCGARQGVCGRMSHASGVRGCVGDVRVNIARRNPRRG